MITDSHTVGKHFNTHTLIEKIASDHFGHECQISFGVFRDTMTVTA